MRQLGHLGHLASRAALAAAGMLAGCGSGASADSGLTAYMRAAGAQFVPGAIDETPSTADGPTINVIRTNNSKVFPGAADRTLGGSATGTARAVLIGLEGDSGHWILPMGAEDFDFPGSYAFSTRLSFSPTIPAGTYSLVLRAVDANDVAGTPQGMALMVVPAAPAGALVVTLEWDADADLDLKLRMPDINDPSMTDDVWAKAPLALPPRSSSEPPPAPDEVKAAGQLDMDSNGQCRIDGKRQENIVFPNPPPSGKYEVRVDAFSMCGQVSTHWHAIAVAGTDTLGEAHGQMSDADTRFAHTAGSGILAFGFTIP
jgi:hypothetical protein